MCQACVPELSAKPEVDAAQSDSVVAASHELSLPALVAIIVCSVMGFLAVMGGLVWLVLWLQPQLAAL